MKGLLVVPGVIAVLALTLGCGRGGDGPPSAPVEGQVSAPTARPTQAPVRSTPGGPVRVSANGSWFDPPVRAERLPGGVWYCDRGTVHFASQTQGKGTCPRCKAKLKRAGGAAASTPTAAAAP